MISRGLGSQVDDGSARRTVRDAFHTIGAAGCRLVGLARTDNLSIRRFDTESEFARRRLLLLESLGILRVPLHRLDAVGRACAPCVAFAGKYVLAVSGFQPETKLALFVFVQFELAGH